MGTIRAVAAILLLSASGLVACGPTACPAIGYVSSVRLHVTPERAPTLKDLTAELCQDGTCTTVPLDLGGSPTATPSYPVPVNPSPASGGPVSSSAPHSTPMPLAQRGADGSIDFTIPLGRLNAHPLDLYTTGTDTQGWSIGTSHVRLAPTTAYPHGKECGGPTTASATLDRLGLRSG